MASSGAGRFLRILPVIDPHAALQPVTLTTAAHKLPYTSGAGAGNCCRLKSGFGLGQIDKILRHAFLLEYANHHVVIAAGAGKSALKRSASAIRKIADIPRNLVG